MKFKKLRDTLLCNKPRRTPNENKKFVVKACENGKEKILTDLFEYCKLDTLAMVEIYKKLLS